MDNMLSVGFYIQRARINKRGLAPIVIRIRLHATTRDISSGVKIQPEMWNSRFGSAAGRSEAAKQINQLLDTAKKKLFNLYIQLSHGGEVFVDELLDAFHGKGVSEERTLLKLVSEHNNLVKARIGRDYTKSTYDKYWAMEVRVNQYVTKHLQKRDIPIRKLDRRFIASFFQYLKDVHKNEHNSATKTTKNLKRVLSYAVEEGYLRQNPFTGFKCGYKETCQTVLTLEELQRIEHKTFSLPRLELVRNLFLFQCYTGLSYVDMAELRWKNVVKRSDDAYWLEISRRKTGQITQIPLFPVAIRIIARYNQAAVNEPNNLLLPGCKIQKANSYLKEIADLCGIMKPLSTHAGRRTFASTVMLNHGVRIEAVSRMLAHSSIRVTQLYAKIFDQHLLEQTRHISWLWEGSDSPAPISQPKNENL